MLQCDSRPWQPAGSLGEDCWCPWRLGSQLHRPLWGAKHFGNTHFLFSGRPTEFGESSAQSIRQVASVFIPSSACNGWTQKTPFGKLRPTSRGPIGQRRPKSPERGSPGLRPPGLPGRHRSSPPALPPPSLQPQIWQEVTRTLLHVIKSPEGKRPRKPRHAPSTPANIPAQSPEPLRRRGVGTAFLSGGGRAL